MKEIEKREIRANEKSAIDVSRRHVRRMRTVAGRTFSHGGNAALHHASVYNSNARSHASLEAGDERALN